jgi:hypothetical protein
MKKDRKDGTPYEFHWHRYSSAAYGSDKDIVARPFGLPTDVVIRAQSRVLSEVIHILESLDLHTEKPPWKPQND